MTSTKVYKTNKSASELQFIFNDLQKFAHYHPLIISISEENKNGYYKVKEKPFPSFPFALFYFVKQ